MPIIRKRKRVTKSSVTRSKKQGGKNNTKRNGGKKKSTTKRKGGNKKTRKRKGGNPDDNKKTYEKKLKDYEVNRADFDKTVRDSKCPRPPRNRPSWASPTASGWGMAPYDRHQEFVPPERPIEEKKRFNFGIYDRKFKKDDDGLWSRGLSDAKSIADLHNTPTEKDVKDWYLENGDQREGPFSPKEIGHAAFTDTEDKSLFDFLYHHPSRAWARGGGRKTRKLRGGNPDEERKKQVEELMKKWQPVEGKGPLPETAANLTAKKTVELEKAQREKEELERILQEIEEERREEEYERWVERDSKIRGGYGIYW